MLAYDRPNIPKTAPITDAARWEKKPPPPEEVAAGALGGVPEGGFLLALPWPLLDVDPPEVDFWLVFLALEAALALADLVPLEVVFPPPLDGGSFLTSVAFRLRVAVGRFELEWGVFFFISHQSWERRKSSLILYRPYWRIW